MDFSHSMFFLSMHGSESGDDRKGQAESKLGWSWALYLYLLVLDEFVCVSSVSRMYTATTLLVARSDGPFFYFCGKLLLKNPHIRSYCMITILVRGTGVQQDKKETGYIQ